MLRIGVDIQRGGRDTRFNTKARFLGRGKSAARSTTLTRFGRSAKWTELIDRKLILPLLEAARYLRIAVSSRIRESGRKASGSMPSYDPASPQKGRRWLVAPDKPQPHASKYRIKEGPLAGWAAYSSLEKYYRLLGKTGAMKLSESGELWDSFAERPVRPGLVTIDFRGSRKRTARGVPPFHAIKLPKERVQNRVIARRIAGSQNISGILQPTQAELRQAQRIIAQIVRRTLGVGEDDADLLGRFVDVSAARAKLAKYRGKTSTTRIEESKKYARISTMLGIR